MENELNEVQDHGESSERSARGAGAETATEGGTTDRRSFLGGVAAAAGGGLAAILGERSIVRPVRAAGTAGDVFDVDPSADPDGTFPQSVASGGPTTSGAILWTRIAPGAYVEGEPLGVEVAADPDFEEVVHRGTVDASAIGPEHDYAVKVDLDGRLESNARYHYRFSYAGTRSRVGRCRTLPASGDDLDSVRFGVLTCQDYQNGLYGAYGHLAGEDLDYLLHLGDFIYESADGAYTSPTGDVERDISLPSGGSLAETLEDFRHLYNVYRGDPLLQRAMEQHTLIAGWDDHEVANDRYWDYATGSPRLPPHENGDDPEFAVELTANGIQAWVEHMPARVEYDPGEEDLHEQFRLWRGFEFGDLVSLSVTDERLFREAPPCDNFNPICWGNDEPGRTMLGDAQKAWFTDRVTGSDATWTVWMNEVLSMPLTIGEGEGGVEFLHDSWDGFAAERRELMDVAAEAENFVTLTGDLHAAMAGIQHASYGDDRGEPVGVELMTPAVTSVNTADVVELPFWGEQLFSGFLKLTNDHLRFADWFHQGYSVVEFTGNDCTFTVYAVDKDQPGPDADRAVLTRLRIPEGEPTIDDAPQAALTVDPGTAAAGEPVTFDASASRHHDGRIAAYEWGLGDGTTARGERVTHAFEEAGTYTVRLRATDDDGTPDTAAATVTVEGSAEDGECASEETSTVRGHLSGAGDAEHLTYATRTADPCELALELSGSADADFDLYVTLDGRAPREGDFDRRSWSANATESIRLGASDLSRGQRLGVLVASFTGGGDFELAITERGGGDRST